MPRTSFGKVASLEASLYMRNQLLRDADWASMAHSLEVRVPLVDVPLLRAVAPMMIALPNGFGKALSRNQSTACVTSGHYEPAQDGLRYAGQRMAAAG